MLKPAVRRGLKVATAVVTVLVVAVMVVGWRLSVGPIPAAMLVPAVEHALEAQIDGGKARVGQASIAWFPQAGSLGLQLDGVFLDDRAGRPVIRAGQVDGALALDSVLKLTPMAGRMAARDFFIAVSVSPQGRYALGYEARGEPMIITGLDVLFADLTGKPRYGRPMSFLRELDFRGGTIALREVKGPVAWAAKVDRIVFAKAGDRLSGDTRVVVNTGSRKARLSLRTRAAVGLKEAMIDTSVHDLVPARVFPSVGATKQLALLDAPVQARGRLEYGASRGVGSADLVVEAGAGRLRIGRAYERFHSAKVITTYQPGTDAVRLRAFRVDAERTRLDLTGLLVVVPEKDGVPAQVRYEIGGPDNRLALSPSEQPQPITNLSLKGRYLPGMLKVDEGSLLLAGAPVGLTATLSRGATPDLSWGVKASVAVAGNVGREQIFAFWPEGFGRTARGYLRRALTQADISKVRMVADIPAGQIDKRKLADPMLRVDFDFRDVTFVIKEGFSPIEDAVGHGVLQGDRFDLTVSTGRLDTIRLTEGGVEIPRLNPRGARATFRAKATGDVRQMLQVVDQKPWRLISREGFDPRRLSGQVDAQIEITRPMLKLVKSSEYGIHYTGRLRQGGFELGGGLALRGADLTFDGSQKGLEAKGAGRVGPYRGLIEVKSDYNGPLPAVNTIDADGRLDLAAAVSGREGRGAPIKARLVHGATGLQGVIRSKAFDGKVTWRRGRQLTVEGISEPAALRAAGIPAPAGLPARMPVRAVLNQAAGAWAGGIEADALSGALTVTPGVRPKLRYAAEIAPDEARRLGLSDLPMFARAQTVSIEAATGAGTGSATYDVGPLEGRVDWSPAKGRGVAYRWRTTLDQAALAAVGAPLKPPSPLALDVTAVGSRGVMSGQAEIAGAALRFTASSLPAGRRQINFSGPITAASLQRLGLDASESVDGLLGVAGRLESGGGKTSGRLDADLTRAALTVPDSDWKKPAGKAARAYAEFTRRPDGAIVIDRVAAEGPGMELLAAATIQNGRLVSLATRQMRLDGLFDGDVTALRDAAGGLEVKVSGSFLDARPFGRRAAKAPGGGSGGASQEPIHLDVALTQVRLSDIATVRSVRATGVWGPPSVRRMDAAAQAAGGSAMSLRIFPDAKGTAVSLKAADVGDAVRTLAGVSTLRGGQATGTGRLVEGGLDLKLDARNVRIAKVPAMAQMFTVASLQGLADTLNGDGILFTRMEAAMRIRGAKIYIDSANANGPAIGLTAKGQLDTDKETIDVSGAIAPAYALNAMAGNLPVVGQLLTSRKGEGMFGITYTARGPMASPKVMANPLSLAAPGIFRRMFEVPSAKPSS